MIINTGFSRRRERNDRLPPGQYETRDFPVLSFGPTPHIDKAQWQLEVFGLVKHPTTWTWDEFAKLPHQDIHTDTHCVTRWSKLDTNWTGVGSAGIHLFAMAIRFRLKAEDLKSMVFGYPTLSSALPYLLE